MRRRFAVLTAVLALAGSLVPARSATPAPYLVGAAVRDISPIGLGVINQGGYGFGDGSQLASQLIGPGGRNQYAGEHIAARALVVTDAASGVTIAMATVETQGMFAAYQNDPADGLDAIEHRVAALRPISASNIVIANDHTHAGPDAIGVWGFISHEYLDTIAQQTVDAIVAAYDARRPASIVAGASDAPDLIYNMTCTEALNQDASANYPNTICDPFEDSKDSWVRVLQARAADTGEVLTTVMSYGAHATLGGGSGVHGDWPQFLSDALTAKYGGIGIAFEGTNGRIQPCRPRCSFTDSSTPGYSIGDRKSAYTTMLMYHVAKALTDAPPVTGPVAASKAFIRHEVVNAGVYALLIHGEVAGAAIQRSQSSPWLVGNTIRTVVSALRIGTLLINGAPGEPYPNIPAGVSEQTNVPPQRHWTLALADDQLGYLMAPVEGWAGPASQVAVNDNVIFNISPTVGDHVMCAQIRLARAVGFTYAPIVPDARCTVWNTVDSLGDPLAL